MPRTPDYFAGKTVIITGAASGIGRATALIFAREGANVVAADINADGAAKTAAEVNAKGAQALSVAVDVTQRAQVDEMVRRALDGFGSVQFLFNSAGAALRRAKFLEIDDDLYRPHLRAQHQGRVLRHAGDAAAHAGQPLRRDRQRRIDGGEARRPGTSVHYAAAKGAVVSMTLGVAREFASSGIRCLSISPGPIRTPFQEAARTSPEIMQRFLADVPMGRFGEPEEIGELVLFMCSDACPFMTGDTVFANGGGGWR